MVRIKSDAPPVARAVTLARVKSPESSGTDAYVQQLKAFFVTPRVVHEGDIVQVPNDVPPTGSSDAAKDGENPMDFAFTSKPRTFLYFQVTLVDAEGPDALVNVDSTRLVSAGAVNSRIPPQQPRNPKLILPSLQRLVVPAVQGQLPLSILFCGPKGSGKGSACRALAESLGVHFVSCVHILHLLLYMYFLTQVYVAFQIFPH